MAKIDVDELKAELNLTPFGAQGWMQNKNFSDRGHYQQEAVQVF